jgi:replicative DNA helicase
MSDESVQVEELPQATQEHPFMPYEEQAIISFAFDEDKTFAQTLRFLKPEHFRLETHQFVYELIRRYFEIDGHVPTRAMARAWAERNLTPDMDYRPVLEAIDRRSDPREMGAIRKSILDWTRRKVLTQLSTQEAIQAIARNDIEFIGNIYDEARGVSSNQNIGIDFFNEYPMYLDKTNVETITAGFTELDAFLNGGVERGQVFMWQGATNVGKSIFLTHNGRACVEKGYKVLHISLEMSVEAVSVRYIGAFTKEHKDRRFESEVKSQITSKLEKFKATYGNSLRIVKYDNGEPTVDDVHRLIENLRREGFNPDVVIIDYLECMQARHTYERKEEWQAQSKVAQQICWLATKAKVVVFTATQTNREGYKDTESGLKSPGLDKTAGSYNKTHHIDCICSIAQTPDEHAEGLYKIKIEKSRHGARDITIRVRVDYNTMHMSGLDPVK